MNPVVRQAKSNRQPAAGAYSAKAQAAKYSAARIVGAPKVRHNPAVGGQVIRGQKSGPSSPQPERTRQRGPMPAQQSFREPDKARPTSAPVPGEGPQVPRARRAAVRLTAKADAVKRQRVTV